jgi:hypothetical protein
MKPILDDYVQARKRKGLGVIRYQILSRLSKANDNRPEKG